MWTWETVLTLAIALIGAVLGILGTWWQFNNDLVKLRVLFHIAVRFSVGFIRQTPVPPFLLDYF
jgi:ABC-type amino acid transport system permease subunit